MLEHETHGTYYTKVQSVLESKWRELNTRGSNSGVYRFFSTSGQTLGLIDLPAQSGQVAASQETRRPEHEAGQ